jgi:predicted transposase/invertase (TIGR01784 family)
MFVDFLQDFIPIDILKSVRPEDIEDISERFVPLFQEARDSDTVKRINLKNGPLFVIAIVEHESGVNYRASFKMLQYICLVLEHYEKEVNEGQPGLSLTKNFRYPPVLPIVFYDGSEAWTAQMNFSGRTEMKEVFAKYIPSFEYELVDLKRYSLEDLMSFRDALSVVMAIDKAPESGKTVWLENLFKEYVATLNIPVNLRKLITDVLTVLLRRQGVPNERINTVIDTIEKKEGSDMFDRMVEGLIEERQQALEEASVKAWAEASEKTRAEEEKKNYQHLLESAQKLKAKGYPAGDIADSLSLPEEVVAAL